MNQPDRRSILRFLFGAPVLHAAVTGETLQIGDAALEVSLDSDRFDLPREALIAWVARCARAVSGYLGRFPVRTARVRIADAPGRRGVSNGRSFGNGGATCRITVGQHASLADLTADWVLTHEMVHFAFPSVPERNHWIEEGSATYIEPIARAKAGILSPREAWFEMVRDMPQGLPQSSDRGLDNTHTWARTYWGGALFCLLADVEIRKLTAAAKGLPDAMRAINLAGGTIVADWPLERALEIGDKATDGKTLMELYEKMRATPVPVDLPALWKQLGIERHGDAVTIDPHAPMAAVREAILPAKPVP
jgi:hypothetical protein